MLLITRGRHTGHQTGYDDRWEAAFKWVFYVEGEEMYMYCKLCLKFDAKNNQKQAKVWKKETCITIRKEKLNTRHPLYSGKH